jgi:hypothetical protein
MKIYNKNASGEQLHHLKSIKEAAYEGGSCSLQPEVPKGSSYSTTIKINRSARTLYKAVQSLVGRPLNPDTLLHYNTKSVVYSFNKVNNLNPILTDPIDRILVKIFISIDVLFNK